MLEAPGIRRPEWVERVRKDPAALREMLAAHGSPPGTGPSVTELQQGPRGRRLGARPPRPRGSGQRRSRPRHC
jgi:hypothetical protein